MKVRTLRMKRAVLCSAALALTMAAPRVAGQTRDNPTYFTGPAAIAHIWVYDGTQATWFTDIDVHFLGEFGDLFRTAAVNAGGASASAETSLDAFAAKASATANTSATGHAYKLAIARDPQNRQQVMMRLKAKAVAGVSGDPGEIAGGGWAVTVCIPEGPSTVFYDDQGRLNWNEIRCAGGVGTLPYSIQGHVMAGRDIPSGRTQKVTYVWGVPTEENGTGMSVGATIDRAVPVFPGLPYLVKVQAAAGGNTLSAVDPTIEADPSNPDVTFEFPNVGANPDPQPLLDDLTPEALRARGIDPQPFIDLGFLAPPSDQPPSDQPPSDPPIDTQPPSTLATPTPYSDATGWAKSPVSIAFTASDGLEGSGVKEIRVTLTGAATGSQVLPGHVGSIQVAAEGTTFVNYFAVDNAGNQEQAKIVRLQIDRTPPTLSGLPANCVLWPPDHQLVNVAHVSASDGLSGLAGPLSIAVTSNEPELGVGDGDIGPDSVIAGGNVEVRAERSGLGGGRVYAITATAADVAGNTTTSTATCRVPREAR